MVISDFPSMCFMHDVPDVTISSVTSDVNVTIYFGSVQFSEVYTPDSSHSVLIVGLADMFADLMHNSVQPIEPGNYVTRTLCTFFTLRITADGLTQDINSMIFPCRQKVGISPAGGILTTMGERELCDETFYLTYVEGPYKLRMKIYTSDGRVVSIDLSSYGTSFTGDAVTYAFNREWLQNQASGVAGMYLIKCEAEIVARSGIVIDVYVVNFTYVPHRYRKTVLFDNVFGVPETLTFRGSESESNTYEAQFSRVAGKLKRLAVDAYTEHALCSGLISESEYRVAESLLEADDVHVVGTDQILDVVVTGSECEHVEPKEKSAIFTLRYRLSDKPKVLVARKDRPVGIFAKTFAEPFD